MNKLELEKLAFICMCNSNDRRLILEKKDMQFHDFDRLIYLMDYIGLHQLSLELWNKHGTKFGKEFEALEKIINNEETSDKYSDYEYELDIQEKWVENFFKSIRSNDIREWFKKKLEDNSIKNIP